MEYTACKLAELISTRISHDLAGGIGSLGNMLDCLDAGETLETEDKNILDNVAESLSARQKFLRVAFGVETKSISAEDLEAICTKYLATVGSRAYKINLHLSNTAPELAKYICLCTMCAAEVIIKNAETGISVTKNNIMINVVSDAKLSATKINAYKQILAGQPLDDGEASQLVHLIYLRELLGKDVPIKLETKDENSLSLVIG